MLPDRVSNPGPQTYESGALPIALRGPAFKFGYNCHNIHVQENTYFHHCNSLKLLVCSVDLHIFATLGGGVADEFFGEYGVGVSLISQVFDFDCHNPQLHFDFVLVLIIFSQWMVVNLLTLIQFGTPGKGVF